MVLLEKDLVLFSDTALVSTYFAILLVTFLRNSDVGREWLRSVCLERYRMPEIFVLIGPNVKQDYLAASLRSKSFHAC